jgi:hypothetical protein
LWKNVNKKQLVKAKKIATKRMRIKFDRKKKPKKDKIVTEKQFKK